MADAYDLTKLDPNSFEHLVNMLALRVLGPGLTGFGPGADGGRDGYFEGEAPYPSLTDKWSGLWYLQSKFHKPHLSRDPQKWLLDQIGDELDQFSDPNSKRKWPDYWIVATNIDQSGVPETGSFDKARALVASRRPGLEKHFHIWGGSKIVGLLIQFPQVADYYKHFLTPGHVFTALFEGIKDRQAELRTILYHLIVTQFDEQQYTKLEQAGSSADARPGIHRLFVDLPFRANEYDLEGLVMEYMVRTSSKNHRIDKAQPLDPKWQFWRREPSRARVWFVKGGPGQGKSTVGQYFCQIQRAALILGEHDFTVTDRRRDLAFEVKEAAEAAKLWPLVPRIPIQIELRDFAQWFGRRSKETPKGILTYLADRISVGVEQEVLVGTLKRALQLRSWFVVFDGLDEVPQDVKDSVAAAVQSFIDDTVVEQDSDLLTICTSRPQGYSGQFAELDGPTINLISLSPDQSLQCARPLLALNRSEEEAKKYFQVLKSAIGSSSVRELMTTPLQSHIMAIVVRGGAKPPERRWQLFNNFYEVIKAREANRDLPDPRLAKLLREDDLLLKTVHNRLGFVLQARAETSEGAQTKLTKEEFRDLVSDAVAQMVESHLLNTIDVLMNATTDRLVLVSTPDDGDHVRFDIRQLQEFFAAEFIYEYVSSDELGARIKILSADSHWREVTHFLLSALIEGNRTTEMSVAIAALEGINEGDGDPVERVLRRRLARGALLVARLLQEGVLEQDRRIRQQFRKCLEPIAGLTELSDLQSLANVHQPNSQIWLWNFLIEVIRESDPTESIGAALLLTRSLPDDNDAVPLVKDIILSCPRSYLSVLLDSRTPDYRRGFLNQPLEKTWFLEMTLELLTRKDWIQLGEKGIAAGVRILENNRERVIKIAEQKGLSPTHVRLLSLLLSPTPENREVKIDCGVIRGSDYKFNWMTGLPSEYQDLNLPDGFGESRGLLDLIWLVVRFAKTRDKSAFLRLISNQDFTLLNILPSHINAYVPRLFDCAWHIDKHRDRLERINQIQFEQLLNQEEVDGLKLAPVLMSFSFTHGSIVSSEQWDKLVTDFPDIALFVWSRELSEGVSSANYNFLTSGAAVAKLIAACIRHPEVLPEYAWVWSELAKHSGEDESKLKTALLQSSQDAPTRVWAPRFNFPLLKLTLPTEASLLPHLVNAMMPDLEPILRADIAADIKEILREQVQEIVSNLRDLEDLVPDDTLSKDIRGAAVLLLLVAKRFTDQSILSKYYEPGVRQWFLRALISYLGLFSKEADSRTRLLVGTLLDLARESYEDRQQIQALFAVWRESSASPVHRAGGEKLWLEGSVISIINSI